MTRLLGARGPALTRKLLVIAVTTVVLIAGLAKAGFPGGPVIVITVDGVMPPNEKTILIDKYGRKVIYNATQERSGSRITRNGKDWLVVTYDRAARQYVISDPTVSDMPALKLNAPPASMGIPTKSTR